jgi:hypothetical protein
MSDVVTDVPAAPVDAPEAEQETAEVFDQDRAMAKIKKANDEAKGLRTRVKELEAYEAKVREFEESQKSEADKVQERAAAAEKRASDAEAELTRERIARRHHLDEDDMDLLGSGTEEQIEARAKKIATKNAAVAAASGTAPPSGKPVERLRPGATTSDKDLAPQDAYPAHWIRK